MKILQARDNLKKRKRSPENKVKAKRAKSSNNPLALIAEEIHESISTLTTISTRERRMGARGQAGVNESLSERAIVVLHREFSQLDSKMYFELVVRC